MGGQDINVLSIPWNIIANYASSHIRRVHNREPTKNEINELRDFIDGKADTYLLATEHDCIYEFWNQVEISVKSYYENDH